MSDVVRQWMDTDGHHVLVMTGDRHTFELLLERESLTWRVVRAGLRPKFRLPVDRIMAAIQQFIPLMLCHCRHSRTQPSLTTDVIPRS